MNDDDLPPPAYSEQELDQKIATALQASLNVSDDGEWEIWDEAKFEAAARKLANANNATSSSSSVPSSSYFNEKRLQVEALRGSSKPQEPHVHVEQQPPASSSASSSAVHQIPNADDDDEDHLIPPPPFTPVGPSLDGPPFEQTEVLQPEPVIPLSPEPVIMQPPEPEHVFLQPAEPEPVILHPPEQEPIIIPTPSPSSSLSPAESVSLQPPQPEILHRFSMPVIPQQPAPKKIRRPVTSTFSSTPLVGFNSSIAYNKPLPVQQQRVQQVDPTAFYNSAVSAHLKPSSIQQPIRPPARQNWDANRQTHWNMYPS